jgi:hypothetical protein
VGIILLGALAGGCGSGKSRYPGVHLEGSVSLDGNLIAEGKLQFVPQEPNRGPPVWAAIRDGRYDAPSVPLGKLRVSISASKKTGRMIQEYSQPHEETVSIIPKSYEEGIAIEVTGDDPNRNFELRSR